MEPRLIFYGQTLPGFRGFVTHAFGELKERYDRLYVPCAGELMGAKMAIAAGWEPSRIVTSDISLYSTLVGGFVMGQDFGEMREPWKFEAPQWEHFSKEAKDNDELYGALLLYMKYLQFNLSVRYEEEHARALLIDTRRHLDYVMRKLVRLREEVGGITYRVADLRAELVEIRSSGTHVGYVNSPAYKGDYGKMFAFGGHITGGPKIDEYNPEEEFWNDFDGGLVAPSLEIWGRYKQVKDERKGHIVCAVNAKADRIDHLLSNRPEEFSRKGLFVYSDQKVDREGTALLGFRDEIKADSVITMHTVSSTVAQALRGLWCHRLGTSNAEWMVMMCVDGKAFSIVGLMMQQVMKSGAWLMENFGMSAPSELYPRLNRLAMYCLTTHGAWRRLAQERPHSSSIHQPKGLQTTCLTKWRKSKLDTGILDLVKRERMPGKAMYKLVYRCEWRDWTFDDCLQRFLKEEAEWHTRRAKPSK